MLLLMGIAGLSACTTKPAVEAPPTEPVYTRERMALDDVDAPLEVYDPFEAYNRGIYRLNARLDDLVLNPAVRVYRFVVPGFLRTGVRNFFTNLDNLRTLANQLLQFKGRAALDTTGRLLTNTTIGLGGLLDPASHLGIRQHNEDFGQTLGFYRVPKGPYLVLPLFGPSTLRGAIGRATDALALDLLDPLDLDTRPGRRYAYYPLLILNTRDTTAFQYYETGSPFEYELVRLLFVTMRQLEIDK